MRPNREGSEETPTLGPRGGFVVRAMRWFPQGRRVRTARAVAVGGCSLRRAVRAARPLRCHLCGIARSPGRSVADAPERMRPNPAKSLSYNAIRKSGGGGGGTPSDHGANGRGGDTGRQTRPTGCDRDADPTTLPTCHIYILILMHRGAPTPNKSILPAGAQVSSRVWHRGNPDWPVSRRSTPHPPWGLGPRERAAPRQGDGRSASTPWPTSRSVSRLPTPRSFRAKAELSCGSNSDPG